MKNTTQNNIFKKLLDQTQPIDFEALAFKEVESLKAELKNLNEDVDSEKAKEIRGRLDKIKASTNHHLILSVENIIKVARSNNWNLCQYNNLIHLYNGTFWEEVDQDLFQKFLGEAAYKMGVPKFNAHYYLFREKLYKQFQSSAYFPKPELDNDRVLINLFNGTFEVTANQVKLIPFDPKHFLTYQLPFKYNTNSKRSIFEEYLNTVLPDKELQMILAEYLGFLFIKHGSKALKEEKALLLYGTGANGKSVLFEVLNALLGSANVSSYSLQDLTNESGYYRGMIANKLVNYASEISDKMDISKFKQMVSGEPMGARLPYEKPFTMTQYAKLMFNCNELPKDVEHNNAYFRRLIIIPFNVTILPENQDRQLHVKIIDNELSGVFNWILEGLDRLLKQGRFTVSKVAEQVVDTYKMESDTVKLFLFENGYKKSTVKCTKLKELYEEYRTFCSDGGFQPVNKANFNKRLKSAGINTERRNIGNVVFVSNIKDNDKAQKMLDLN